MENEAFTWQNTLIVANISTLHNMHYALFIY